MPRIAIVVLAVAAALWIMITARAVLQPLLISIVIWFLLSATARGFARLRGGRGAVPGPGAKLATGITFAAVMVMLGLMISRSLERLGQNLPVYGRNLTETLRPGAELLGISRLPRFTELAEGTDVAGIAFDLLGSVAGTVGATVIIIVYVVFIFAEASHFDRKLAVLVPDPERRAELSTLLDDIRAQVETYLGVKCLLGLIQALPTYVVLAVVGVASPVVWAVLIFLLSFIPTIGSMVGIALPALIALIQFETATPFLIVVALLAPVQLVASNWLEPRMMGQSLNLSPLVVFLAIFGGGAIWGVVGAFISVPVLSIAAIAMAQARSTRPVAVILSRDGDVAPSPLDAPREHPGEG